MADDTGLILVGIGMGHINGMTIEAMQEMKSANHRFLEAYTAKWDDEDLNLLENEVGTITPLMRPDIEKPEKLLNMAKKTKVALLIIGDPLQATTHVDLQLRAHDAGIQCHVVHGISITGLVTGAIGLSNYRFGRQTTLTYSYGDWIVTSPLEVIAINRALGMHTLVLFDLDPTGSGIGEQQPMQPGDAVISIRRMMKKMKKGLDDFDEGSDLARVKGGAFRSILDSMETIECVLCTDMGTSRQSIVYGNLTQIATAPSGGLHCMVVPAKPNDIEAKALSRWAKQ